VSARRGAGVAGATVAVVLTLVAAGCASTSEAASKSATDAVAPPTTVQSPATTPTTRPAWPPCVAAGDASRSFRPEGPAPAPGQMPAGSAMAEIVANGHLTVGVDENTLYFSSKDPLTPGEITGFEADLARAIAAAIFGSDDPKYIRFVTVTTEEKFKVVTEGDVDLTIDVATVNCDRWNDVDFTTAYYQAFQQLMVRGDSPIKGQADLANKRVCVTSPSSSESFVKANIPTAKLRRAVTRTECLTRLQENKVDAIVLPSSIQAGLLVQDPNNDLFPDALLDASGKPSTNTYAIAVNKKHPDLTRFVNALLEQWRHDGTLDRPDTLDALQAKNLPIYLRKSAPDARYLG